MRCAETRERSPIQSSHLADIEANEHCPAACGGATCSTAAVGQKLTLSCYLVRNGGEKQAMNVVPESHAGMEFIRDLRAGKPRNESISPRM